MARSDVRSDSADKTLQQSGATNKSYVVCCVMSNLLWVFEIVAEKRHL